MKRHGSTRPTRHAENWSNGEGGGRRHCCARQDARDEQGRLSSLTLENCAPHPLRFASQEGHVFMTQFISSTPAAIAPLKAPPDPSRLVTCPLCHTRHAWLTPEALQTGEGWQCVRCRQLWDARRLGTVAAYAAWVAQRRALSGSVAAQPSYGQCRVSDMFQRTIPRITATPFPHGTTKAAGLQRRFNSRAPSAGPGVSSGRSALLFEQETRTLLLARFGREDKTSRSARSRTCNNNSGLMSALPTLASCSPKTKRCGSSRPG